MFSKNSTSFTNTPIFIGGDGRSGTTLLSVILDSHPELSVGPELHFNGPENLGSYVLECLKLLIANDPRAYGKGLKENKHLKPGVQFAKRCHRFGLEFDELQTLIRKHLGDTNSRLTSFEERCVLINSIGEYILSKTGKKRWGIKVMREIRNIHLYERIWPNAQFIHIIRDGRDVAASQMTEHQSWGYNDIKNAAKSWVDIIERTRKNVNSGNLFEVKYEDIVTNTRTTLESMIEFLKIPWGDALLNHHQMEHSLYKNPYNHASIDTVTNPVNASSLGRYQRDLSADQINAFHKVAGNMLKSLGYEI